MSTNIVQLNINVQQAPTPSRLQQTGAVLSQGATNTAKNTLTLLTAPSDLTPLLTGSKAVTSITQSAGTATLAAAAAHNVAVGDTAYITVAGASPAAYNGVVIATSTGTTTLTYAVPSGTATPATGTIIYTLEDVAELLAMVTTFFAQGTSVPLYVLELGIGNPNDGIATLTAWLIANPLTIYSFLVPRTWDANTNFLSLIASYEAPSSRLYFWVTTTLATYAAYTPLMKCVNALVEAPVFDAYAANVLTAISWSGGTVTAATTTAHGVSPGAYFTIAGCTPAGYNGTFLALPGTTGSTLLYAVASNPGAESVLGTLVASYYASAGIPALEFSQAAPFYVSLSYTPGPLSKVSPFGNTYIFGVTPFPRNGNAALLTTLNAANISIIGTGYQGGVSTATVAWGLMLDGNQFNYWYSIDWVQINLALDAANEIINGSNDRINPLYLNQQGVTRVQGRLARTMQNAITYGMALGTIVTPELTSDVFDAELNAGTFAAQAVVNAIPFVAYYTADPSNYKLGIYGGYGIVYIPQLGFEQIIINLTVTQFISQ